MILFLSLGQTAAADDLALRQQAQALEKQGRWFEACCLYDELLSKDRSRTDLRESYRRCLRHFRQQRRLEDPALQSLLNKLSAAEAADLYDQVLNLVVKYYPERERVELTTLFHQGLFELQSSMQKKAFLERHLGQISEVDLAEFRAELEQWEGKKVVGRGQAREIGRKIIIMGGQFGLPPGVVALELACGACNSLDEYSLYLAPSSVSPAQALQKNKIVGIGIEVTLLGQRLEVARVYRKSSAAEAGLVKGDRILRIDDHWVDPLAPDLAAEHLLGEPGTFVEVEVLPRGQSMPQIFKVERQAALPVSVDAEVRGEMGFYFGYLHIHHFQESTVQEVKEVLAEWEESPLPLRGVILDLRGNPGGLFQSAIDMAALFLPKGVIVHTYGPLDGLTKEYRSHNLAPFALPLIVVIDGETASAAEVVAGALKDNGRALVVGQPTYGKGSIQCVIPLERVPGGLRLTVAKFATPARVPFSGRGLLPDFPVSDPDPDAALKAAEQILRSQMMMFP